MTTTEVVPENTLSRALRAALGVLRAHPSVVEVSPPVRNKFGIVIVDFIIGIDMPNAWMARGHSDNGVFTREPVTLKFWDDYPLSAPLPLLRADFDRSLAHVQPGSPSSRPVPCLYDGLLSELLQQRGFSAILDQFVIWLTNAAMGTLIDPKQGWEPVRRDSLRDMLIADSGLLRARVARHGGHTAFDLDCLRIPSQEGHFFFAETGRDEVKLSPDTMGERIFRSRDLGDGAKQDKGLMLFIWPSKDDAGRPFVADRYFPETVTDVASLKARAVDYGCAKGVADALSWLGNCVKGLRAPPGAPVVIALAVRRPFNIIGTTSPLELLFYMVEVGAPELFPEGDATRIFPMAHREAVTPALLSQLSGVKLGPERLKWISLGAGSLGSKIAIHLARSGRAPNIVIDKGHLLPHMAGRHGLLPASSRWLGSKAQGVVTAIEALGQHASSYTKNIVGVTRDKSDATTMLPKKSWAVVNSTASLVVREALASVPPEITIPRVIEVALMAKGTIGLLTREGEKRNPNTAELFAETYEMARANEPVRSAVFGQGDALTRQTIGEGCGSMTMTVSDADISALAAPMASILGGWQETGLPNSAEVMIGVRSGPNLSWRAQTVPPFIRFRPDAHADICVSVSHRADQAIQAEIARWPGVETGGILLGRFSEATQTFIIIDVMAAPDDSLRSAGEFVLGTKGLRKGLTDYAVSVDGCLYCIGTWHNHLVNCGASAIDRATAAAIAAAQPMPSVLLIKTPARYRAILAEPRPVDEQT